jgi:hypothetical protein
VTRADDRLMGALRAEYAAIYGYGPVGARLEGAAQAELAAQAEAAHRSRRDVLLMRLTTAGLKPPAAETAYELPFPVPDRVAALRLALLIEERTAAIWRDAAADLTGTDRQLAMDAVVDGAVRATRLRRASGVNPVVVPFPGRI